MLFRVSRYSASPLASISEIQITESVNNLADQLCSLNLLESAQLVSLLQVF